MKRQFFSIIKSAVLELSRQLCLCNNVDLQERVVWVWLLQTLYLHLSLSLLHFGTIYTGRGGLGPATADRGFLLFAIDGRRCGGSSWAAMRYITGGARIGALQTTLFLPRTGLPFQPATNGSTSAPTTLQRETGEDE